MDGAGLIFDFDTTAFGPSVSVRFGDTDVVEWQVFFFSFIHCECSKARANLFCRDFKCKAITSMPDTHTICTRCFAKIAAGAGVFQQQQHHNKQVADRATYISLC